MKYIIGSWLLFGLMGFLLSSCESGQDDMEISSPNGQIKVNLSLSEDGKLVYNVFRDTVCVLLDSELGLVMKAEDFSKNLQLTAFSAPEVVTDSYSLVQGKKSHYQYQANRRVVELSNANGHRMEVVFQVSNDGVAFRYQFPDASTDQQEVTEERTTFHFPESAKAWLQPMAAAKTGWARSNPSYEEYFLKDVPVSTTSSIAAGWAYPTLFKNNDNWVMITEVGLNRGYCGTRLDNSLTEDHTNYQVAFPQDAEVIKDKQKLPQFTLPYATPWRVIVTGELSTIVESTLGTDLAQGSKLETTDWIKPGRASWSWVLLKDDFTVYKVQKEFIDYAADMGWEYCLIDGLWDTQIGYEQIGELVKYAESKGVGVLLWYNSSGDWNDTHQTPKHMMLEKDTRLEEFKRIAEMGVKGVKVDFFGGDGNSVINYYIDILEDAAEAKLMVNFHGCTLPRGWHRTYPHLLTAEAIRGMEFITFTQEGADSAMSHCTMIPFTRNVMDPMDFTPTAFSGLPGLERKTSNAFELALPVLFQSGIQHFAETPQGMQTTPDYVQDFMREIPVSWDETKLVEGTPGKEVIMARRKGETWYVGGINGENKEKQFVLNLPFIEKKEAVLITDGDSNNSFSKELVYTNEDNQVAMSMRGNGGFVMVF
ncbi:glycoside hydrolase family 97 catalytic domain-containing protein [Limibacter armeniacum]|uniref:glycoside hydrolase family 97 protein n=1 Tax=Limibacter armeniacum TaxID=466084 RepID=UPI002FE523C8